MPCKKLNEILSESHIEKITNYLKRTNATLDGLHKVLEEERFKSREVGLSYLKHWLWTEAKVQKTNIKPEMEIVWC